MYILKGKECFDSAHFLRGHEGKCANLHGHRWTVEYGIKSEGLIEEGSSREMVADFTEVKALMKDVIAHFDHKLILEALPAKANGLPLTYEEKFVSACYDMGFSIVFVPFRTTAENMSSFFFSLIEQRLQEGDLNYIKVDYVTVYETPNNSATWREE